MTQDITGFGTIVTLIASTTYKNALPLSDFADDADSLDMPSIEIAQVAMGMNGNLIAWAHAVAVPVTISLIPNSPSDLAMQVLAKANMVGTNKNSANDIITLNVVYPDGTSVQFTGGKLVNAPLGNGVSSTGRMKTKTYQFMFEKIV